MQTRRFESPTSSNIVQTPYSSNFLPIRSTSQNYAYRSDPLTLLPPPPEYALNAHTHNYQGLLENLKRLNVTDIGEVKAIIRLSNYGEKGKPFWKLLAQTNWSKITAPGRYLIKLLKSSG